MLRCERFALIGPAAKYTLTLTGTYFGGKSTSIFWLLHRLASGVRRDFAFHDELRWASTYGLLESVRKRKVGSDVTDEDGTFTGNRRYRDQAHEIPGVSPAIITRLLDNSNGFRYAILLSNPPTLPEHADFPGWRQGLVQLGVTPNGAQVATGWSDIGHVLVGGMTGSGKSNFLRLLVQQAIAEGHALALAYPDGRTFPQ